MSSDLYNDGDYAATFTLPPGYYKVYDGPTIQLPPEPFNFYKLAAKIMLTVSAVILVITCYQVFTRWHVLRNRRRYFRRNMRLLREQFLIYHERLRTAGVHRRVCVGGLDEAVLNFLPVFVYDSSPDPEAEPPECAVCLLEFEVGETGRVLPKCKHSFHVECIDVWFQRHSTCPLCRRVVKIEPGSVPESYYNPVGADVVVVVNVCGGPEEVNEVQAGTGSGSNRGMRKTASFGERRKPMDISIMMLSRHESFGRSTEAEASPMSLMLSFKRILSRERRDGGVSQSGNASCSAVAELDIEKGREGDE